jgi:hypothetical protein
MIAREIKLRAEVSASAGGSIASPSRSPESGALPIAVYLGCASLLLAQIAFNFVDIDLWHQMGLIRASLAAGRLLTEDPFAYVPTVRPMIDHEWGAGALAFFLSRWMGGLGLLLLKYGAALGTLLLTLRLAQLRGASAGVAGFLAPLGILLLYLGFLPAVRAHAYSFLFTAALLWALEMDRRGQQRWLWAWVAAFPLWVNLHAGFVVGVGFVFLYGVEQAVLQKPWRNAGLVLCAMGLGVFLNPYGIRYFAYLARALAMARPRIAEWGPIWTFGWSLTFVFGLAVLVAVYCLVELHTGRLAGALLLAASGSEALLHRKLLPFFAITWLCYVPSYFQRTRAGQWLQQFTRRRVRFVVVAWTFMIVIALVAAIRQKFWRVEVPQTSGDVSYPVGAVDYLAAQGFHGNVMVPFRSGAYVSWKLYPAVKVSLDSRYEVAYPDEWVERVFRFYEGRQGWRDTLAAYPTDLVLVPRNAPVRTQIRELDWKPIYQDAQFELYARPGLQLPAVEQSAESFTGVFP